MLIRVQNNQSNQLLGKLQELGVGRDYGYIDVLPIETSVPFVKSTSSGVGITERLTVEQIYTNVVANNNLSFDYLSLLIVASMIAGSGLATNNPVVVVASMLVSPLMGPILAFSLGSLINEKRMVASGLLNEAFSLLVCVIVGFLLAFIFLPFGPSLGWPTSEMSSRGVWQALVFGLLVASPSGVGVALSITSGGIASLVGVAISASLLPPAVNTGMMINYGLFGPLLHSDVEMVPSLIIAGISFALCILNIFCIYVFCIIYFRIKRISPVSKHTDLFRNFQNNLAQKPDKKFGQAEVKDEDLVEELKG
eukprot:CAMPEP_0114610786 /NCGR_PEP_ID=MMETSP0168-20121206/3780_1 /TAXON_ID=95228 ORGANISM="Vannella sp., Strain DIVA3 517/6/12" /NCGR_SAMPLE_ID=MMETSP0168 /ASSEMBLY_ACC=CAM_ASM_000044 /LENGTH=308 /DNA_ID=CAMNT_0001821739 /DNA_START=50 /DNA_END=973 /DNA_ORIENTATION=+